jgi:hypothetical protein
LRQARDKAGHHSDLVFRQCTDKTKPRADSEIEIGQRQDRTPFRTVKLRQYRDKTGHN